MHGESRQNARTSCTVRSPTTVDALATIAKEGEGNAKAAEASVPAGHAEDYAENRLKDWLTVGAPTARASARLSAGLPSAL